MSVVQDDDTAVASTLNQQEEDAAAAMEGVEEEQKEEEQEQGQESQNEHETPPPTAKSYPIPQNDEGAAVCFGSDVKQSLYCGRQLGREAIPGSDGRCGPTQGPQCASCQRMQVGGKRLEVLQLLFPGLTEEQLVAALRKRGGILYMALVWLRDHCGIPMVDLQHAMPPPGARDNHPPGGGLPPPLTAVNDELIRRVLEVLGEDNVELQTVEAALRRNNSDVAETMAYLLDSDPADLVTAVQEDEQIAAAYATALEGFQTARGHAIDETAQQPVPERALKELETNPYLQKMIKLQNDDTDTDDNTEQQDKELEKTAQQEERLQKAMADGHDMIQIIPRNDNDNNNNGDDDDDDEGTPSPPSPQAFCHVCSTKIPGTFSGSFQCQSCRLCEGCIHAKVVFKCPRTANGGHLHCHALDPFEDFHQRRYNTCDIQGKGCLNCEHLTWCCRRCDFDVCMVCMANGHHLLYSRILQAKMFIPDDEPENYSGGLFDSSSDEEEEETAGGGGSGEGPVEEGQGTAEVADLFADSDEEEEETPGGEGEEIAGEEANPHPPTALAEDGPQDGEGQGDDDLPPAAPAEGEEQGGEGNGAGEEIDQERAVGGDDDEGVGGEGRGDNQPEGEEGGGGGEDRVDEDEGAEERGGEDEGYIDQDVLEEVDEEGAVTMEDAAGTTPSSSGYDAILAERIAAARWEGNATRVTSVGEVVVGTGTIGTTAPDHPPPLPANPIRAPVRNVPAAETRLSARATAALQDFSSMGNTANGVSATTTDGSNVVTTAASDVQHAEELLHRAHLLRDASTMSALGEAVAAGNIEIAGTLLLAHSYAPERKKRKARIDSNNEDEDEQEEKEDEEQVQRCFCGDVIDYETAPDGAVGCLSGHGMHPGCAADQLLGGGLCPTCRSPLFFPKVPGPEAKSAMEFAAQELDQRKEEEEKKARLEVEERAAQGLDIAVFVNDIVRISADEELCAMELMKCPGKTGWSTDMALSCGKIGRVTEVIRDTEAGEKLLAIRVKTTDLGHSYGYGDERFRCLGCSDDFNTRTSKSGQKCIYCHRCQTCCQSDMSHSCLRSSFEWYWTLSVISLIARASAAALWDKSLLDKDLAEAADAEQHIFRLRAELKAVQAARAAVKDAMEKAEANTRPSMITRGMSTGSGAAVRSAVDEISPADWRRARHLLLLARQWGDSDSACAKRASLYDLVRSGEIDSVGRIVRRYNASRIADAARWADAVSETGEYVVEKFAKVDLVAWPSPSAPKTGYSLGPKSRFLSRAELLDDNGIFWLQVDESSFVDLTRFNGKVVSDLSDRKSTRALIGARVCRAPGGDTNDENQNNRVGVIQGIPESGKVIVWWNNREQWFNAGKDGKHDLIFASLPPPPPQGWLCVRPHGLGSPSVVKRGRSALRCYSCGDGLVPTSESVQTFSTVKIDDATIRKGDTLLVAATLQPVEVVSVEKSKIVCSFPGLDMGKNEGRESGNAAWTVWYRHEDLVYPSAKDTGMFDPNELVSVDGHLRSRRELILMFGNESRARQAWNEAKGSSSAKRKAFEEQSASCFASCARGHLLHARCFQGALLAGQTCPTAGCNEPLWVPSVKQQQRDDDACCGGEGNGVEAQALLDAGELVGHDAYIRARDEAAATGAAHNEDIRIDGAELKMCPACFSGPLFNSNCSDMASHHGQCTVAAVGGGSCNFSASASDIASRMMTLSATTMVAQVLPKCPTHNVPVMFNGCMACGHLFTDTNWSKMPKWEATAKAALELDVKKREAARLLANEIRKEAAMLQFERDALQYPMDDWYRRMSTLSEEFSDCNSAGEAAKFDALPPLPPPTADYAPTGCGPECVLSHHFDGNCLMCGERFNRHNGHRCRRDGSRGSWDVAPVRRLERDEQDMFGGDDGGDY